MTDEINEIDEG